MSWTWLIEHWKLWGVPTIAVGLVAWANRFYSLRKARAEALSAEIALEQARQDSNQELSPHDDRILHFLETEVGIGKPFVGGHSQFRANEIAEALSIPKATVVDRLKRLEAQDKVRRSSGTLDDTSPRWNIVPT